MNRLIIFALDNPRVASPIAVYAVTLAVIYGASLAYQSYFPEHFAKMGNELSIIALGVVVNAAFDRNSRFYNLHAPEVVVYIFAFLIFFAVSFGCYHYNWSYPG